MKRLEYDVTLSEAYTHVINECFGLWKLSGNYLGKETYIDGENVETLVFMGSAIFLLGLSVEKQGFNVRASGVDSVDTLDLVKELYPKLFQEGVKGELWLIP